VAAIRAHPRLVLHMACAALHSMTRGNAENVTRARRAGAVNAINTALTNYHAGEQDVRTFATHLLHQLGFQPQDAITVQPSFVWAVVPAVFAFVAGAYTC